MHCRVCSAREVNELGDLEYYSGFAWKVFDCLGCGCRFTKHDESIYNWLHSQPASIYGPYRELADKCKYLFDKGDLSGLRQELCKTAKYRFVIETIEQQPQSGRLLEFGCARGFLTSYFILAGCEIIGADVSPQAIAGAREAFGNHFISADSTVIQDRAPYDAIYHVGTIGCVSDPLSFTCHLLRMLKPGGQLLFNAPNAESCGLKGQLWIDAAPPPDVVTLFRPGFWRKQLSTVADVVEEVEVYPRDQAVGIGLMKLLGRQWQKPMPLALDTSANHYQRGRPDYNERNHRLWQIFERSSLKISRVTHLSNLAPSQPSPFGLFVKMTKR
jgi:SAM-dependent methyltransferase